MSEFEIKNEYLAGVYKSVCERNPNEPEFLQAVGEVLETLVPVVERRPDLVAAGVIDRMVEPERMITFRVSWVDDSGKVRRQPRIAACSSTPRSARTRAVCVCHPSVNASVIKFLGFEQRLQELAHNAPHGRRQGRFRLRSEGKSDNEIMRFCQSFMTELSQHIGADTDVPAGESASEAREIGFMFGQ